MRHAYRKDANHGAIVSTLEALGAGVYDAASDGSPFDAVVFFRGRTYLVEIKDGSKPPSGRALTDKEVRLHALARDHGCTIPILRSEDDALALLGARRSA